MANKNIFKKSIAFILIAVFAAVDFYSFRGIVYAETSIDDTQNKMEKIQNKIEQAQKDLNLSNVLLQKNKVQVNTTQSLIQKTAEEISRKETEIENLNERIELNNSLLVGYMQEAYFEGDRNPVLALATNDAGLDGLLGNSDQLMSVNDKILGVLNEINQAKNQLDQVKGDLADKKNDHETLLQKQKIEQGGIVSDIVETKATLQDLQKKFGELQSDLNRLLGANYNAKDIKDAVKFASEKTGVPDGFLVGVLKMETNLGANVGGCTYGEVESGAEANYKKGKLGKTAWATFQARRNTFKGICKEVGVDYQKQKVSCNPRGYTGTGGAMGVAQFMPDTWNAYKSQVSSIAGHRPPSPWNLTDGVLAMALKLSRVPGVTAGKTSAYKTASCAYLGTCYKPYIDGILYWADHYKELI